MPKKKQVTPTDQFSITLPIQSIEMLEDLVPRGIFGASRAQVARKLIHDRLEELASKGAVEWKGPKR